MHNIEAIKAAIQAMDNQIRQASKDVILNPESVNIAALSQKTYDFCDEATNAAQKYLQTEAERKQIADSMQNLITSLDQLINAIRTIED